MEKKRIPKRRFKEFFEAGEWEETPLSSFATFKKGVGYTKEDLQREGIPIILYGRLYTDYESVIESVDDYVNPIARSLYSTGHEIIVPASGETAEDIAVASAVRTPGIILGGDLNVIYPKDEYDTHFLSLYISHGKAKKSLSRKAQGKSVVHLHNEDLRDLNITAPNKNEQVKIGDFCRRLDALISLHQQKLSKLKDLKQAYLTEMFPAPGEKRPRRRFKGFSGDWKKSKFGDVVTQADIKVNPWQENVDLYSVTIEDGLIAKSDRYNRESLVKKQDIFSLVCPRQIVYNPMNMTLGSIGYNANNFDVAVSGYYTILSVNDGIDPYYLYTYMKLRNTLSVYSVYATGSLKEKQRLQFPTLVGIPCILPELEEQKKIAHVASLLNERIIKAKNSLEKLQSLKQAYLSELFV